MRKSIQVLIALLVVNCAAQAGIFYNDAALWAADVSGRTDINFEGIAPVNDSTPFGFGPGASITVGGVSFAVGPTGTDNILFVIGDGSYYPTTAAVSAQSTSNGPNDLLITLPGAFTALGFHFGDFPGSTWTITLSDGSVQSVASGGIPQLAFFGVAAPEGLGITSVDVTTPPGAFVLNIADFSYGTAVPEPSSFLLFGVLLAGTLMHRRWRV